MIKYKNVRELRKKNCSFAEKLKGNNYSIISSVMQAKQSEYH